jgi:hypothetical protein
MRKIRSRNRETRIAIVHHLVEPTPRVDLVERGSKDTADDRKVFGSEKSHSWLTILIAVGSFGAEGGCHLFFLSREIK